MAHRRFRLDLLRPGPYRVWLYNSGGRWAEADVDVKPAGITKLVLRRPKATLLIPIAGIAPEGHRDLKILRAERRASLDSKGEWTWEAWQGYRVSQEPEAVKIEGLPPGLVRVSVIAFGFRLAWTETVRLAEGRETSAPLLTLIPGRAIRVRIERPDGGPIPDEVRFFASRDDLWPDLSQRRVLGEPIWILSGLSPGSFEVSASALNDLEGEVSVTVPEDRDIETTIQLKPR